MEEKKVLRENLDKALAVGDLFLVNYYGSQLQNISMIEQRSEESLKEMKIKLALIRAECDSKAEDLMAQIRIFGKIVY